VGANAYTSSFSYPGDPTTPGCKWSVATSREPAFILIHVASIDPAYENATRVPGGNFPRIPSLPISYEDALPLLRVLQGQGRLAREIGDDWEGGLLDETEYWTGPSEKQIRLVNDVDTKVTKIWSVFAYIPGHIKVRIFSVSAARSEG
jgi:N-acetylated-alpha-linked acidic dipeptidase